MSTGLKNALARFVQAGRTFLAILAESDDPQGDYLRALETRVRRLEDEMKDLRGQPSSPEQAQA